MEVNVLLGHYAYETAVVLSVHSSRAGAQEAQTAHEAALRDPAAGRYDQYDWYEIHAFTPVFRRVRSA